MSRPGWLLTRLRCVTTLRSHSQDIPSKKVVDPRKRKPHDDDMAQGYEELSFSAPFPESTNRDKTDGSRGPSAPMVRVPVPFVPGFDPAETLARDLAAATDDARHLHYDLLPHLTLPQSSASQQDLESTGIENTFYNRIMKAIRQLSLWKPWGRGDVVAPRALNVRDPYPAPSQSTMHRIAVIGIHGWSPMPMMHRLIGPPVPSSFFVDAFCDALAEAASRDPADFRHFGGAWDTQSLYASNWPSTAAKTSTMGSRSTASLAPSILKIPLEGTGKLLERVALFEDHVRRHYAEPLRTVSQVYILAHSQGVPVGLLLLQRLLEQRLLPPADRVCIVFQAMCGIVHGPVPHFGSSLYMTWLESEASRELFQLALPHMEATPVEPKLKSQERSRSTSLDPTLPSDPSTPPSRPPSLPSRPSFPSSPIQEEPLLDALDTTPATPPPISAQIHDAIRMLLARPRLYILATAAWLDPVVPMYSALFHGHSHPRLLRQLFVAKSEAQVSPSPNPNPSTRVNKGVGTRSKDIIPEADRFPQLFAVFLLTRLNAGRTDFHLLFLLSRFFLGSLIDLTRGINAHSLVYDLPHAYMAAIQCMTLAVSTSPSPMASSTPSSLKKTVSPEFDGFQASSQQSRALSPTLDFWIPTQLSLLFRHAVPEDHVALRHLKTLYLAWTPKTKDLQLLKLALVSFEAYK